MKNKYIDSKTFEINDDIFEVDEAIAKSISLLNKKGYKTLFCCSGHNDKEIHKFKTTNENFNEMKNLNEQLAEYDIVKKGNFTTIYYKHKDSRIYIDFEQNYNFDVLPLGFKKVPLWDSDKNNWSDSEFSGIEKYIDLYNGDKRKSDEEINSNIKESNQAIYEWALNLPSRN